MTSRDRAKYDEREDGHGDRAPERPEVLGHGPADTVDEDERALQTNDELAVESHHLPQAGDADAEATGAEVEGHFIGTNPYLMEKQAQAKQQDFRAEAERQRTANEAAGDRGMVDRVKERFRGGSR
jgi:hypothetical protein